MDQFNTRETQKQTSYIQWWRGGKECVIQIGQLVCHIERNTENGSPPHPREKTIPDPLNVNENKWDIYNWDIMINEQKINYNECTIMKHR